MKKNTSTYFWASEACKTFEYKKGLKSYHWYFYNKRTYLITSTFELISQLGQYSYRIDILLEYETFKAKNIFPTWKTHNRYYIIL